MNEIPCKEKNFTFEDIKDCEEAFVTGTFAGIIPVSKIEKFVLNSTNPNSLVNKIRASYNQYINREITS
jgi:branched-chain amino acid aminotransferase